MSASDVVPAVADPFSLLHEPGSVFEVRIPNAGRAGTISGYFDDCEAAAKAIARYDHKAPGIYVTLNPVNPALLARVGQPSQGTGPRDDLRRRRGTPVNTADRRRLPPAGRDLGDR